MSGQMGSHNSQYRTITDVSLMQSIAELRRNCASCLCNPVTQKLKCQILALGPRSERYDADEIEEVSSDFLKYPSVNQRICAILPAYFLVIV